MTFVLLIVLVALLQMAHWRLLLAILGPRWNRWIVGCTLAVNGFLAVYVAMRLSGLANHGLMTVMRSAARMVEYFQLLAAFNVLMAALALALWWILRNRHEALGTDASRRWFLGTGAGAGLGLLSTVVKEGEREAYGAPVVMRLSLAFPDLPKGFHGLRVMFLTDLHAGPHVGEGTMTHWRHLADREHPDLLLFGGDMVDSLPEEILSVCRVFQNFQAPLGCFGVLGNHDHFTDPWPVQQALQSIGIQCLENRSVVLARNSDRLALVGLSDPMAAHGPMARIHNATGPDPAKATEGLEAGLWRLCLCHRPSRWDLARQTGAKLTLSGHTHGGQMNLVPGINSARIMGPYTHGLYQEGVHSLYVSAGLGVAGLPLRLGAPPELTVITLLRT